MPFVYQPLPYKDPRGPGYTRAFFPMGTVLAVECKQRGWLAAMPAQGWVYDAEGRVLQEGPKRETPKPPAVAEGEFVPLGAKPPKPRKPRKPRS